MALTGSLVGIRQVQVICPNCRDTFGVEYNHSVNGSFYRTLNRDRGQRSATSSIHTRQRRSLKCPYCSFKFISEREW